MKTNVERVEKEYKEKAQRNMIESEIKNFSYWKNNVKKMMLELNMKKKILNIIKFIF